MHTFEYLNVNSPAHCRYIKEVGSVVNSNLLPHQVQATCAVFLRTVALSGDHVVWLIAHDAVVGCLWNLLGSRQGESSLSRGLPLACFVAKAPGTLVLILLVRGSQGLLLLRLRHLRSLLAQTKQNSETKEAAYPDAGLP